MADEELSAAEELETAPPPAPQEGDEPTPLPDGLDNEETGEGEGAEEPDEFEDFEHEGKAYKVPKSLVGHLMRDKDYTEKSQANAAKARALEAREAEIEERSKLTDEELDLKAEIKSLDKQIEAYKKLSQEDWDAHFARNRDFADQHWRRYQLLEKQRGEVAQNLEGKAKERTESASKDFDKRVQDVFAEASKIIPGWKPEKANETITELYQYAQSEGISDQVIRANWTPTFVKLLHRARLGDQLLKKQQTAPKAAAPAPQPSITVKPKNSPPPTGLSDKLPVDEWLKRRNAQLRKRA